MISSTGLSSRRLGGAAHERRLVALMSLPRPRGLPLALPLVLPLSPREECDESPSSSPPPPPPPCSTQSSPLPSLPTVPSLIERRRPLPVTRESCGTSAASLE